MIRTHDIFIDNGVLQCVFQRIRHKEIVDTPACVLGSGTETVGPPGIGAFQIGIKVPEGVDKAGFGQSCKFVPLFVRETGVSAVGLRIFEVDLLMGNIQVTAADDGLFLFQFL